MADNNKKALILTYNKFQDHEVIYPYYYLKGEGFDVQIAADTEGKIYGILGAHMNSDIDITKIIGAGNISTWTDSIINDYEILVIPGGVKALEKLRQSKVAIELVKKWNNIGKTILVLCNGPQLMISADILKNRHISGYYAIEQDIINAGAAYSPAPVVIDNNIISCPHYDFMGEWMKTGLEWHYKRDKGNDS